jgi:CrcB protein
VRNVLAVFLGGAIGTLLRLQLDAIIPHRDDQFPLSTLLINVVGSLVLSILVSRLWPAVPGWVRAGLGPGLVGGFTTFSAVMVSMVTLAASSQVPLALGYLAATLVLGFGAAALGFRIGWRRDAVPTREVDE